VVTEKTTLFQELQEEDLYIKYKKLSRHLELLEIQESYIKDEQASLKRELIRAQEEVRRIQSVPLVIGQFLEPIDQYTGIVGSTTGSNYVVRILSTLDREQAIVQRCSTPPFQCAGGHLTSRSRQLHRNAWSGREARRDLSRC